MALTETDAEIVARALIDRESFSVLIERYEAKLNRYLLRLGVYAFEDRQDVLQDIFIKVYRNLNAFDTKLSFSSWIYRIAHNEAMSWFRKKSVRPEHFLVPDSNAILEQIAGGTLSEELHMAQETSKEIQDALAVLDQKYRTILLLRFFEEKSYEEIADILKIPVGTVATLLHRGKEQLRIVLAAKQTL